MPIKLPVIDDRTYEQLVSDALARIPVHTPEWTHTGGADPGVTLVELFGFMAETLLYRANLIPDRNRLKFLQLLGQPLRPASSARGLVALLNNNGERRNFTLPKGLIFYAGALPFRGEAGLDVPPVEGFACIKQITLDPDPALVDYYRQLYEATGRDFGGLDATDDIAPILYETVAANDVASGLDVGTQAVDGALWIALLLPTGETKKQRIREQLAGRTLSIGLSPRPSDVSARLVPGSPANPPPSLEVWMPALDVASGTLNSAPFRRLDSLAPEGFPDRSGILQVTMPSDPAQIANWPEAEPLEAGVGDLPPLLTDDGLASRVLTWLRIDGLANAGVRLAWVGLHCVPVTQRYHVASERLAPGTGESDQGCRLAQRQVLAESLELQVGGEPWILTDELAAAPREDQKGAKVFALDAEDGLLRFGSGEHGARPATAASMTASYDWSAGNLGNVAVDTINRGDNLPSGFKVRNPMPTEGGTGAETADAAERRIPLYLRNRDRAVSVSDFQEILHDVPGADVGRIEVLSAWHPELSPALPGDQPGVVTIMVIPRTDAKRPDAPLPNAEFINALCTHLAPRRLVTCEVLLRAPAYVPVWISVGIDIVAGESLAIVRERVRASLRNYLSPLPLSVRGVASSAPGLEQGWPLFRSVTALELAAVVARAAGVAGVSSLLLGDGAGATRDSVAMHGLQLPFIAGLAVTQGESVPLTDLSGRDRIDDEPGGGKAGKSRRARRLPVPKIPDGC